MHGEVTARLRCSSPRELCRTILLRALEWGARPMHTLTVLERTDGRARPLPTPEFQSEESNTIRYGGTMRARTVFSKKPKPSLHIR